MTLLTRCRPLLGTFVEITVSQDEAALVDDAFAAIARVHELMSFHSNDSDLARLRLARPGSAVEVAPETVVVLRSALELYAATAGLFDVTVGRQLVWSGFLPRPANSGFKSFTGTSADLEIVGDTQVRCHRPMLIDLGGIAKGFAVDRAVSVLREAGAREALVNAGGDMAMFGEHTWDIALRDADGMVRSTIRLSNCAIASSANLLDRRRRFGRTHTAHIGVGGAPVLAPGRVSVIADRCVLADAMTKVALADRALAEEMLARFGGRLLVETRQLKAA